MHRFNRHVGSDFDDFLAEEGLLEDATAVAIKRVIADRGRGRPLVDTIRGRIEPLGGIELVLPQREAIHDPADLDE